jgi:hypothetical protein
MGLFQQGAGNGPRGRKKIIDFKSIATEVTEDSSQYPLEGCTENFKTRGDDVLVFSVLSVLSVTSVAKRFDLKV